MIHCPTREKWLLHLHNNQERQQGGHISWTYADERVTNEFLHAVFNRSKPKGCFGWSRPSVLVFRAPLVSDVPTHCFRYDE